MSTTSSPAIRRPHRRHTKVTGRRSNQSDALLTPSAVEFLASLSRRFEGRRQHLLHARTRHRAAYRHGSLPTFPPETDWIRRTEWRIAPLPPGLRRRRVEIAGGVDRRTMVTALNSSADLYMADLEDGTAPTWDNILRGHLNLCDAADRTIAYEDDAGYHGLDRRTATLCVRPRGWHQCEPNLLVAGQPIAAALFDVGLYAYHNAASLVARGTGVYFYLPKLETYFEARLWNDVFGTLEHALGLERGTIRASVLIETVPAAFQMDEILYELRDHAAGLRHGRWDYIFSFIKTFGHRAEYLMPDRAAIDRRQPFLRASIDLLIQTCRRRAATAIGGKVARVPVPSGADDRETRLERVMEELVQEFEDGFDGTQVVHPVLADMAKGIFDARNSSAEGRTRRTPPAVIADDLIAPPDGDITEAGLAANIRVTIQYLASWLGGCGSVPIDGLIENTGSVEIARTQVWQWVRHQAMLNDGRRVTPELVRSLVHDELARLRRHLGPVAFRVEHFETAAHFAISLMTGPFREYMTDITFGALRPTGTTPPGT